MSNVSLSGGRTGNIVYITGTLYYGHLNNKTSNASPGLVRQNISMPDTSKTGDLSGKWEGYQTNGQLIMSYEINLVKTGKNSYSGFDYCRWVKSSNNTPLQYQGTELPNAKKAFIAVFQDNVLNAVETNNIGNSKWDLQNEKFKLITDNGALVLINADGNTGQRRFALKHTGDYPAEYLKYVISKGSLKIDTVHYHNPNPAPSITYNEKGYLEFSINNKTANDFRGLNVSLAIDNNGTGIDQLAENQPLDVDANAQKAVDIQLTSNLMLPVNSIKVRLTISPNSVPLAIKYFSIPTNAFFKTANITVASYTTPRMRSISGYYGFLNNPYANVAAALEPLIASGDKIAGMWKAVFLTMGDGGYNINEAQGYAIGETCIKAVENKARNGDAEASFLMFYACQMGLEGEAGKSYAASFLEKAATAGFKPAVYDYANQFIWHSDYASAYPLLIKSYGMGVKKAAVTIGSMYEHGYSVSQDIDSAIMWYKKGMAYGDPEAALQYANVLSKGTNNSPPDINKAISIATGAAAKNYTPAMVFMGMIYSGGKNGIAKSNLSAIKWFKEGAEKGDRQAMLALGEAYLEGKGALKDENTGLFWIKKSAELGSPKAMVVLAAYYNNETNGQKDVIAARYWYNQAVLNGYAQGDATGVNAAKDSFFNFWKYADFSPSYIYVNEYGEKVADGDDGLANGFISGIFGSMASYYGNQQQLIDGLEFIYKKNGYKIYGGTLSSNFVSNLVLKRGQTIYIKSYGVISTGMMSGLANADGLGNAWAEYRFIPNIPCSAVMGAIKNGTWQFVGQSKAYTADKDGPFMMALNGRDYRNYKGYFDLVIEIPDK